VIYMTSQRAGRKSTARKALYFARRRTDRSLRTSATSANVWNALDSHRSSLHTSSGATDDAVLSQLEFYADVVDLVASSSLSGTSESSTHCTELLRLVDVYASLVDCVGYLGAERAACTAFLPAKSPPQTACRQVDNREMFFYAQAVFSSDVCFRSLRRQVAAADKSNVLAAMQLYNNDDDGLATCRRRILPDLSFAVKSAEQTASSVDVWKCGRARRLRQLRRLHLSLNGSMSDDVDSVLARTERQIAARWIDSRHAAWWRLAVSAGALSTSLLYLLIACACQCKHAGFCNKPRLSSPSRVNAAANIEIDATDDHDINDLERSSRRFASLQFTKSTSV